MFRRALSVFAPNTSDAHGVLSWNPTGMLQQTLAGDLVCSGVGLHSGVFTTVRIFPEVAGEGRYFVVGDGEGVKIPADVEYSVESPLCTTLRRNGCQARTVEHLLSALEACGVDNCRIEIHGGDEVPILDGSAKEWAEAIRRVGLIDAKDDGSNNMVKLMPFLHERVHIPRKGSFIAAFPSTETRITYGIDFPEVSSIGSQWFSCLFNTSTYLNEVASARTFCIYEEIEKMRCAGLIRGGSTENALIFRFSAFDGCLNPPLRFTDEPCRHKLLDLVGDLSLVARDGNQGLPVAHIVSYKGGHALHLEMARRLRKAAECNLQRFATK